eukprot:1911413-Pleurochrysis_carterae.AAC.1
MTSPLRDAHCTPQSSRISNCTMLSILLNVAAFSIAVAIGVHQFWRNGEWDFAAVHAIGPLVVPASVLIAFSQSRNGSTTEPRPHARRMQVDRSRSSLAQLPPRTTSTRRTALVLALLWSSPSCASSCRTVPIITPTMKQLPTRDQQWLNPHRTNFSLAANLLETSACIAIIRGHILSAVWDLARAS